MTQYEKILKRMESDPQRWWLPSDFMQPSLGELFVGYEASARLSELVKKYPNMIESKQDGKFIARRLISKEDQLKRVEAEAELINKRENAKAVHVDLRSND